MAARESRPSAAREGPLGPIAGFLERFRGTGGVPTAATEDLGSELAPVFAALDALEREVAELRSRSETGRARLEHDSNEEAERIMAEARWRADAERADALKAALRAADSEAAALVKQGELDAQEIRERGAERVPAVVAAVVNRILEDTE
jgi:vacuolar-type H+-ATPase subunit H